MIYGLYLSATGVLANSYRQDVIANNLANAETVGFKRQIAAFQQRPTESQAEGRPDLSDPTLDNLGGGFLASPTAVDITQGELESTGNNLDAAIVGKGFFAVDSHGKTKLTRDGRFMLNKDGQLILANTSGDKVLDPDGKPIVIPPTVASQLQLAGDGSITDNGKLVAKLGIFDVPSPEKLVKSAGTLMDYPDANSLKPSDAQIRGGFLERANVDPATEMVQLMETQRQLEANANMIRYQDQAMSELVNSVGKIS